MNPSIREWAEMYVEAVPNTIRPTLDDPRFIAAAMMARRNGWSPTQMGTQVAGRNYANALSPVLIGLMHLEDLGARRPYSTAPTKGNSSGCVVCPPGKPCTDPVTPMNVTHPSHVGDRKRLLDYLRSHGGLTEKERELLMTELITRQRNTMVEAERV